MHSLETGNYTKNARPDVNPRVELREIIENDMKSDRSAHFRKFADKLFDGIDRSDLTGEANDLLSAVVNSWFSYHYPTVFQDAQDRELTRLKKGGKGAQKKAAKIEAARLAAKAARAQVKQAVVSQVIAQTNEKLAATASGIRKLVILDSVLPNGVKLRDATGEECGKAGGLFIRISHEMAQRGIVKGLVGENFTEKEVQKIFKGI